MPADGSSGDTPGSLAPQTSLIDISWINTHINLQDTRLSPISSTSKTQFLLNKSIISESSIFWQHLCSFQFFSFSFSFFDAFYWLSYLIGYIMNTELSHESIMFIKLEDAEKVNSSLLSAFTSFLNQSCSEVALFVHFLLMKMILFSYWYLYLKRN